MFQQVFFSGKLKKMLIFAFFWQLLPPNFCKWSPHEFSEAFLLNNIYMIFFYCFLGLQARFTPKDMS